MSATRPVLVAATATLRAAGVETPEQDARLLMAYACGIELIRLPLLDEIDDDQASRFQKLIMERARRVPLQHLTGRAYFRYLQLEVGPGVFVPRPETEVMTGWAIDQLRPMIMNKKMPLVVELCAGSGAIAKAIATELTGAVVHAVELSEEAAVYAARNLADVPVWLHVGDMADALRELDGTVDLVIANPPYIPLDAYETVALEARDHDPSMALFSGPDGLDAIRALVRVATRLLHPAGLLCFEHADLQGESAPAVVRATGAFVGVRDHLDLARRPRFVTAVRRG